MLTDLIKQREEIEMQIAETMEADRKEVLSEIIALMTLHKIDVVKLPKVIKLTKAVAAKWKDPASDKTWSGRGIAPKFFRDAEANGTVEECRITE